MKAAKQCEDAIAVSGAYDGDATMLQVATNMNQTTRALLSVMRESSREKEH